MWLKIKKSYSYAYRIFLAIAIICYIIFVIFTLLSKELSQNTQTITYISLVAVLLSLPGNINAIVEEYNPKKKVYKLSCKCPKCRHLIEMDMKEE